MTAPDTNDDLIARCLRFLRSKTPRGTTEWALRYSEDVSALCAALTAAQAEIDSYAEVFSEVAKVYDDLTVGAVSKPNTIAADVIAMHNERCWFKQEYDAAQAEIERLSAIADIEKATSFKLRQELSDTLAERGGV